MTYRTLFFVVAALVAVLAVGCVPLPAAPASSTTPLPGGGVNTIVTPGTGPSPETANQAVEWLAGELNVSKGALRLVEAEQIDWTDSCFGLGGPAESCLAAVTPGWRMIFEAAGQQHEVRSDLSGSAFRLVPAQS